MKRQGEKIAKRSHWMILLLVAALVVLPGCLGGGDDDTTRSGGSSGAKDDVDWDNYYNTGDELPGFGDDEILAMTEDDPYDDPFDSATKSSDTDAASEAIYLRVLWGNLIVDWEEQYARNYSGTITLDDGLLVIERTVRFEQRDFEIETRVDPSLVAWQSIIGPHYDGLVLRLEPGTTNDDDNFLHLNIGPYSADFSVTELADMLLLEPSGYGDDQVAIASFQGSGSSAGFLSGHWRDIPNHRGGIFKGKWETGSGTLYGHERCRYFPEDEGQGIIRGKYIDIDGNFMGLLQGRYERTSEDHQAGVFSLDWLDRNYEVTGDAQGFYFKNGSAGYGFALGIWRES